MTYLDEVLDPAELAIMLEEGFVQVRYHPDYPYAIYCYTKQAMFDRKWNHTTKTCRGLIVNEDTSEVLARPFKKFFNQGEPGAALFNPFDQVTVYDKLDGSLGIAYETPDGPAIATKGSFTSDQAVKATQLLRTKYPRYVADEGYTDLFEIIYPENRIVLDYGDEESLRYLGSVWIDDGTDYWNGILMKYWDVPRNVPLFSGEWAFVKHDINLHRPNSEGVVVHCEEYGERIKIKQEDYLELHKVMTGLNERQIWEWYKNFSPREIMQKIPEEMHDWAGPIVVKIDDDFDRLADQVIDFFFQHGFNTTRKDFAVAMKDLPKWQQGALWARYDGNLDRVGEIIWKNIKP